MPHNKYVPLCLRLTQTRKRRINQKMSKQISLRRQRKIFRNTSTPNAGQPSGELRMIVSQQNASVSSSPNVQTSQAGNILLVKQIRTTSSTQSVTIPSSTSSKIVMMSQSGQIQSQGSVIISNKPSNLLSILSNQQASTVQNNEVKMEPPLTLTADI